MIPSIILLRATRENLKTFYWILTEISAFKNIKVIQILISFSLYLYHFIINNYMTGTIKKADILSFNSVYIMLLTGINGKDIRENARTRR